MRRGLILLSICIFILIDSGENTIVKSTASKDELTTEVNLVNNNSSNQELDNVDSIDYAPFMYFNNYEYLGSGHEFAGYKAVLLYPLNENGIYQFRRDGGGTSISYVYQLTEDGIYELSYFPEVYDATDFRNHKDTLDEQKSLIFPAKFKIGDQFNCGYREDQVYEVVDILPNYLLNDQDYQNVVVLSSHQVTDDYTQFFYYAPEYGLILDEFSSKQDELFVVTNQLKKVEKPMNYEHLNVLKKLEKAKVE